MQLLETAMVSAYDSVVITDSGYPGIDRPRIVFVNQAFVRLFGYTPEEVFGRSPKILQGPASDSAEIARMRRCLLLGEVFTAELVNYRKDGMPIHVEVRIMPIRDTAGHLTHWVGVQRDITARKHAEAEHTRLESRLREKQKLESLGTLAGGVAHDFNNLLTIILGNASLARMDTRSPEALEQNLKLIEAAANRAADLCRQMLAYTGKGRYVVRPLQLGPLLRETIELVRSSSGRGHTIETALARGLPPVMGDATQIQQVVMNILLNAIESTGANSGTVRLSVRIEPVDPARLARAEIGTEIIPGNYVVIEVADSGCGIPRSIRSQIFDPFFSTKFTGRGLGLAAVQGIIRAHQGAIELESEPGQGATFRVLLPPAEDPAAATHADQPPGPTQFAGNGRTILVVDDEPVLRETVRELLQHLGYAVLVAADGAAAIELFRHEHTRIDAVLLDLAMPHLDGAATFDALQAIDPGPQTILMSGYSEDEVVQRIAGRKIAAFLQKPFPLQMLLAAIAAAIAAS